MKTLQWLAALLLFSYGGFMVGYLWSHPTPNPKPVAAVVKEEKPKYNWKAIYEDIQAGEGYYRIGISGERRHFEYTLYIVDGDRWFLVHRGHYGPGCGREMDVYYSIHPWKEALKNCLDAPPSDNAKFVVVGPGKPKIVELLISRKGEDN